MAAAAGSELPPSGIIDDLKLPFPSVWVVFGADFELPEGMTWPHDMRSELDEWQVALEKVAYPKEMAREPVNIAGALAARGGHIHGVIIFAAPKAAGLDDAIVWTVSANLDPDSGPPFDTDRQRGLLVGWRSLADMAPIVDNLAVLVAGATWTPPLDEPPGIGNPHSARWARSLQRTKARKAVRAGAGAGVRVIDLGTTTRRNTAGAEATGRTVTAHGRRAYTKRVRIATRDKAGVIVGNVRGEHGVDWLYEPRWIPPAYIHGGGVVGDQVWRLPLPPPPQ